MTFPKNYWPEGEVREPSYTRIFDGKRFIYLWRYYDQLLVSSDHNSVSLFPITSNYFDEFGKHPPAEEMEGGLRKVVLSGGYFNIIFDRFREVYYIFAYHGREIDSRNTVEELMDMVKYPSQFSIVILNKDLTKVGEVLLEKNKYYMENFFVGREGLYLSLNHPLNPEFTDDLIQFQRMELIKK